MNRQMGFKKFHQTAPMETGHSPLEAQDETRAENVF